MNKVPELRLPTSYPSMNAIKSGKQNIHNYESEFWELEYEVYRYLSGLDEGSLNQRYQKLLFNLRRLISKERNIFPIQSFLSSWYWFKKEHQTRLEYYLRGKKPPQTHLSNIKWNTKDNAPAWPKSPNSCDVIFRYGEKQFIEPLLYNGQLRIYSASKYIEGSEDDARTDDELTKTIFLPKSLTRVTTIDGQEIPLRCDVSRSVTNKDYYVYCASCGYHTELFRDFNADCCIVIDQPGEFECRIRDAMKSIVPSWYFTAVPVEYFDPYKLGENERINTILSKDFQYAYQMEYRYSWFSTEGEVAQRYIDIDIGSIEKLARLYCLNEM